MSETGRYFRIGLFFLGALLLAIVMLIMVSSDLFERDPILAETCFDQSIQGLAVGSPVYYRGIKVGQVSEIGVANHFYKTDKTYALVRLKLEHSVLETPGVNGSLSRFREYVQGEIERGFRYRLDSLGITGIVYIEGSYVNQQLSPQLEIDWQPQHLYIPSTPSQFNRISEFIDELMLESDSLNLVGFIQESITLLRNMNSIASNDVPSTLEALRETSIAMRTDLDRVSASITRLLDENLSPSIRQTSNLVQRVDATFQQEVPATLKQSRELMSNINKELSDTGGAMRQLSAEARQTLQETRAAVQQTGLHANKLLTRLERMSDEVEEPLIGTIEDLRDAVTALTRLVEDLEDQPSRLLFSNPPDPVEIPDRR